MYVLDTNAIIYYTDGGPASVIVLERIFAEDDRPVYVSTLTELELFSYARITREEERRLETFLEAVQILPVTSEIARLAARLRRSYPGLKAFDSGIAATAISTNSALVTRNISDFRAVDRLSLMAI